MSQVTLSTFRTLCRQRADMVNSEFVTDDELNVYINNSAAELYDLIVSRFEDYYTSSVDFTIITGNTYTIPADFYKIRGVDYLDGSDWISISPFNFAERNRLNTTHNRLFAPSLQYRLMGSTFMVVPEEQAAGSYRFWYIPAYQEITSDDGYVCSDLQNWHEYVIVDVAMKMKQKQEDDVSVLAMQKQGLTQRIQNMASNRDANSGEHVTDVHSAYDYMGWTYRR